MKQIGIVLLAALSVFASVDAKQKKPSVVYDSRVASEASDEQCTLVCQKKSGLALKSCMDRCVNN